jgi:glycosyl-4,4'-diaponeurosporenoate acyltransferase
MLFHLPILPTILIDIVAWFAIHLGVSYWMTHISLSSLDTTLWLYKQRRWEHNGKIYESLFRVKLWKKRLPDGAALFKGGFRKKYLQGNDQDYLNRFIRETCRAELTHWIVIVFGFLFFIWNMWWVGVVMIVYAVSVNLPCIISQRYNRIRLKKVFLKASIESDKRHI